MAEVAGALVILVFKPLVSKTKKKVQLGAFGAILIHSIVVLLAQRIAC